MTITELMQGKTPNPSYEGPVTANDMVLGVNFSDATSVGDYLVAQQRIKETPGTLEAQTSENEYLRSGVVSTKTSTKRSLSGSGDRYEGDPFQDALLDHTMKYGAGKDVIKGYVYFNILNGKGEKGNATILVTDDYSGAAGENAGFGFTLSAEGTPEEFTYPGE